MIPDNATIARFISLHLAQCPKELMAESTWLLRRNGLISSEAVFIDGTKIEANANKYTFVWKKAVSKNQKNKRKSMILSEKEDAAPAD